MSRIFSNNKLLVFAAVAALVMIVVAGCGGAQQSGGANTGGGGGTLSGEVRIDGSSTVAPISEAVAEEFMAQNPDVKVTVGTSGTGGGFSKFTEGVTDISNASRHIKDEEKAAAEKNSIDYVELPIAYDGISIVVSNANDWAKEITVDELKKAWGPGSKVKTWNEINPSWPNEKLILHGPGTDSGTFDYFTDAINGEEGASRTDFNASEDDNVLVQGVSGDKSSLGYFGYAYYKENTDKIKALKVNGVMPTEETIKDGSYKPLARPVFIYVSKKSLERPEVKAFVEFYLTEGVSLVPEVGYVPLNDADYEKSLELIK